MVHLTVPHGLEQSGGAAWGTRDVCQGPVELLLALEHDAPVREILRDRVRAAAGDRRRLAAMVHARALRADPRPAQPWRRHRLAAEGALRLRRGDRRPRLPRRAGRLAARRRLRGHRAPGSGGGACGEAPRHRARALHPRHAPDPLRRRRLERLAAAGGSEDARLDGVELDGRAAVPAAEPLRGGAGPGRPRRRGGGARRPRRRDARGLQPPPDPRRDGRRLRPVRRRRGRARAPAAPERHPDRAPLLAPADDPQHHRRPLQRRAGTASPAPRPRSPGLPRRRPADGPAGAPTTAAPSGCSGARNRRRSSGARSG